MKIQMHAIGSSQKSVFLKTGSMVTGSSKIWVGVDDTPVELKKSNDGSLELNEWECLCSADTLNVGDCCFGAPLIGVDVCTMTRNKAPTSIILTPICTVLVYQLYSYRYRTILINHNDPVQSSTADLITRTHSTSSDYNMTITVADAGAIKAASSNGTAYYYDIRTGGYIDITESEYNSIAATTPTVPGLSRYGRMFNNTSAYSTSYGMHSDLLLTVNGSHANLYGHVIEAAKSSKYCTYTPLSYTSDSIVIFAQETDTSNMSGNIIQYGVKFSDTMFIVGPKQAVRLNTTGQITSVSNGVATCATHFGVVVDKIDSTHVIMAT